MTGAAQLRPKLHYGQPGWAKAGKVVVPLPERPCGQGALFDTGIQRPSDQRGRLWPTSYALEEVTDDGAETIAKLVKKAVRS